MTVKVYPAEGNGANLRSVVALATEVQAVRDIAIAAGSGVAAENVFVINEEADFDNQTASLITLTPGKYYQLGADITTNKRFEGAGATLRGLGSAAKLTYLGNLPMVTATHGNFSIKEAVLDCPNATVFDVQGDNTGNPNHRANIDSVVVNNCVKLLNSDGAGAQVIDLVQVSNLTGPVGVTFSGTTPAVLWSIQRVSMFGMVAGAVGIDVGTAVTQELEFNNIIMFGDATASAISGLTNSGNITADNLAMVNTCNFSGFTNPLVNINQEDIRWEFQGNAGVPNSIDDALIHTSSNALLTDIIDVNVRVKVNAVFSVDALGRFTSDGTGRLTYVGEKDTRLPIDATASILADSGGDKQVDLCIAINGTVKEATCVQATASATKAAALTTIWQHDFIPGDYIELFVSNDTNDIDLIVTQAVLRIN